MIPSLGPGPRPEPMYIPTPMANITVPKYRYKCLSQNNSGVGKKYIVKSITLPIVSMLIIVPMKGFCFKGIQPRRRINPVMTPANPILTFIS